MIKIVVDGDGGYRIKRGIIFPEWFTSSMGSELWTWTSYRGNALVFSTLESAEKTYNDYLDYKELLKRRKTDKVVKSL